MSGRAYTPAMVAEMWGCSEKTVRNEIAAGRLRHFRVGQKLLRIPPDAVEEYECQNTGSPDTGESGQSASMKAASERTAFRLAKLTGGKLSDF
jgi:excisionase family DNA binding protein